MKEVRETTLERFSISPLDLAALGIWLGFTFLFAGLGFDEKIILCYLLGLPLAAIFIKVTR